MSDKLSVILGTNSAEITLPTGKKFTVKPLDLNDLAKAEEFFGCDLDGFEKALKKMKNIIFSIHLAFSKAAPELTIEEVGSMFGIGDMDEMQKALSVIFASSGMTQKNG